MVMIIRYKMYFVLSIFMAFTSYENIYTIKISRSMAVLSHSTWGIDASLITASSSLVKVEYSLFAREGNG